MARREQTVDFHVHWIRTSSNLFSFAWDNKHLCAVLGKPSSTLGKALQLKQVFLV